MDKSGLRRELGLLHATMFGIGGAISAGVFVMLGHATSLAGTAIVIVLPLCGIINLFTMCSYAELGAAIPSAGGEYTFAKVAYGGLVAFLTGWFEWISNAFFAALSSVGFAYIVSYIVPTINVPLTAVIMIIIFTVINIRGMKEAGTAETMMIVVLLIILAIYFLVGWSYSPETGAPQPSTPKGFLGVAEATAYIFVVYLGAEAIAVTQAEIKNPSKTIPRAIILSAIALIVVYTLIAYVTVRAVSPEILGKEVSPLTYVAGQMMGPLGVFLITIAGMVAALSSLNTSIVAQSRVAYALSRDGYFPKAFLKIHRRFGVPHVAVILSSVFTIALAATGVIQFVGYATDFGFIVGFTLVNLSLIKLRQKKPNLERPFKVPFYPFTPIAGIVTSLVLLLFIDMKVLALGAELTILALLAYYIAIVGHQRIRVAFGGMSLGIGGFAALVAYLIGIGFIQLPTALPKPLATMLFYGLIFVSVICFLAGALNMTGKGRK